MKAMLCRRILFFFKIVLLAYLLICLLMWGIQRYLLFVPSNQILPPADYGLADFTDESLTEKDGTQIHFWHHAARAGHTTIIFFHGNGGNLAYRAQYFEMLAKDGLGIIALDYRGYGLSTGSPSEEGLYEDARSLIHYAMAHYELPLSRIVLYGESLGTGVATQMATEYPAAALILQSPYTSIESLVSKMYPWLPVRVLLQDGFDSLGRIAGLHMPVLIMHGEDDTLVPVDNGRTLFAAASEPKKLVLYPGKGHNDLDIRAMADAVENFISIHR